MSGTYYGQGTPTPPQPMQGHLPPVPAPRTTLPPASPPPPPETKKRSLNLAIIIPWCLSGVLAIALVLVLVLDGHVPGAASAGASKGASSGGSPTHTVIVDFVLNDFASANNNCTGTGGYNDIGAGTPVTIEDSSGTILGAGSLGDGLATGGSCTWVVNIPKVALGKTFYSAEVGRRGKITQSADELKAANYSFSLSLGNG